MKSKCTHERHRYWPDFDDFGVDRQLRVRAIDRHQYHREPSHLMRFAITFCVARDDVCIERQLRMRAIDRH